MVFLNVESLFYFTFNTVSLQDEDCWKKYEAYRNADDGGITDSNPVEKKKKSRNKTE